MSDKLDSPERKSYTRELKSYKVANPATELSNGALEQAFQAYKAFESATKEYLGLITDRLGKEYVAKHTQKMFHAYIKTPKLSKCSMSSLYNTLVVAIENDLPLDGRAAAAIPFNGECTFVMGYRGAQCLLQRVYAANGKPHTKMDWYLIDMKTVTRLKALDNGCNTLLDKNRVMEFLIVNRKLPNIWKEQECLVIYFVDAGGEVLHYELFDTQWLIESAGKKSLFRKKEQDKNTYSSTPWHTKPAEMIAKTGIKRFISNIPAVWDMMHSSNCIQNTIEDYFPEEGIEELSS